MSPFHPYAELHNSMLSSRVEQSGAPWNLHDLCREPIRRIVAEILTLTSGGEFWNMFQDANLVRRWINDLAIVDDIGKAIGMAQH